MKFLALKEVKKRGYTYREINDKIYSYINIDDKFNKYLVIDNKLVDKGILLYINFYPDNWCISKNYTSKITTLFDKNGGELVTAESIYRDNEGEGDMNEFRIETAHIAITLSKQEIIKFIKERKLIESTLFLTRKELNTREISIINFKNKDYKYHNPDLDKEVLVRDNKVIAIGKNIKSYLGGIYQYDLEIDKCTRIFDKNHFKILENKEEMDLEEENWTTNY